MTIIRFALRGIGGERERERERESRVARPLGLDKRQGNKTKLEARRVARGGLVAVQSVHTGGLESRSLALLSSQS